MIESAVSGFQKRGKCCYDMAYLTLMQKGFHMVFFNDVIQQQQIEVVTPTSDNEMENGVIPTPKIPEMPEKVYVLQ